MKHLSLLLVTLIVSSCHLDELISSHPEIKEEPKKCYINVYLVKNGVDSLWLGTQEIECPIEE